MTVYINGTTGYSGPVGTIGDLTTTGNTTLGDASGDTLTINGSTTTLTQGTANGVAYLNGSKVLTTGSALVFDGTNLGLGVTPSAWLSTRKVFQNGNAAFVSATSVPAFLQLSANTFTDSGGTDKYISTAAATNYAQVNGQHQWFYAGSGTAGASVTFTQAMTLDTNGNLGLGIAPSAWGSGYKALDISNYTALYGFSGNTSGVVQNAYYNGTNWIYKNTNAASNYVQSGGVHQWQTAGSGTAGANISFTSGMTLNASGYLAIGDQTSPTTRVDIRGTSANVASTVQIVGTGVSTLLLGQNADGGVIRGQGGNSCITFWTGGTGDTAASGSGSERARINSSGNLLVGSTSTQGSSVGGQFYDATGYPIYYSTFYAPAVGAAGTPVRICARLGETADPALGYVLLCKAYQGGATQSFSGFSGTVYRWRGSAGAFLQCAALQVTVGTAYNGNGYGAANFGNLGWNIVTCTYGGVIYLAVRCTSNTSQGSINIDGIYTNDFVPALVSDGSVSSVTVLATY